MTVTPEALTAGARELIAVCLGVQRNDRVLILSDAATSNLTRYILTAAREATESELYLLPSLNEDYEAAFGLLRDKVLHDRPSVVIFAAKDDQDLLAWDPRYWNLLESIGARNAQMPALDVASLGIGMTANYSEVARFTELVTNTVRGASTATVRNALGTDITFNCDPARPWTAFTGIYTEAGSGGRLPQGETFCSPIDANGVIAASVLGYPFNASTGLLSEAVQFEISDGRVVRINHSDEALVAQLSQWFLNDEHAGRIGEFALGTNQYCDRIRGNLLFDENVPGCHIALGHPFGDYTGASWASEVHVDLVVATPTIHVDGVELLRNGNYLTDNLHLLNGAKQ